ncbi:GvpL/GvpF family gas vesicle protein [Marinobacter gelidimuriae]|uniref:GvpL/GvpF family gas vesicle protein n=1 Tax=Marinobacter gelidimuriae TaxID=2739064 RepID=UPI0003796466|nr:GvpL/GvpF family gas vesicle protein [Marinobacter gelidimuriae]
MNMVKPSTPQRYLYAIVDASQAGKWEDIGINGARVTTIIEGPVAAVVSSIAAKRVRPERANLASHNGVIKLLMQESTVLPVAFGTIADSYQAVQNLLTKNSALLVEQLDSLRGKVEMGLRVRFDVPNIYEYIVSTHHDLRDARDTAYGGLQEPKHGIKIELGGQFDRALAEDRETHTATVLSVLSNHCADIKHNPARNNLEVMNLACLVKREDLKAFEDAVLAAAGQFDNNFAFDFNGPWAPHNFVHIELNIKSSHVSRR